MEQIEKDALLEEARRHVAAVNGQISRRLVELDAELDMAAAAHLKIKGETAFEDRLRSAAVGENLNWHVEQLSRLAGAPYFARCDLEFGDEPLRPYYFAKFPASQLGIYSWTSPLAAARFEEPGPVAYQTPVGEQRQGRLVRKDQFMIAQGKILFMTTEDERRPRQLIHQEHFTSRKNGFILPEVVAQMEKAQDQVIRADHRGPFVISGPAGSGKTTLALHRVAYLRQAPETAALYPAESIIVLVQDPKTQDYFAHLLPELGINDVEITTFSQWALQILNLRKHFYRVRPGRDEAERDRYEQAKLRALRSGLPGKSRSAKFEGWLKDHYRPHLDDRLWTLLQTELAEGALDRHDLTLLLMAQQRADSRLTREVEHYTWLRGGKVRTTIAREPLNYALMLVDEFQNYLPEQLKLLKSTMNPQQASMLYVGDLAQQTQFGTIRHWAEIAETVEAERTIRLQKVYRNTRQILEYVQALGFTVEIPSGVAEGPSVTERNVAGPEEAVAYVAALPRPEGATIGVIAKEAVRLESYKVAFRNDPAVHCLTIREAQGVEFDVVCLVELDENTFAAEADDPVFAAEQQRVNRDLLYVALTRAISELHVVGEGSIAEILRSVGAST
ncbi:MAG TPA: UvrD-helicase domain-containing protein [Candidatus Saccharimonadia bacterium]|nr:UvrD-helicase domain-containing protein [Candidatus Saccharimonadia bacterium]